MSIEIENMNVWQRFHGVMSDISYIKKEREVTQGARFKYVGHDEVAAKIHVALVKWRLVLQTVTSGDIEDGPHEFRNAKGSRFERRCEVHVTLRFVNIDKPEEVIEMGPFVAASFDSSDKASGKAYSYAMKTALLKAFVLESGERDNEDAEPMEPVSPQAQDRLGGFLNHAEGLINQAYQFMESPGDEEIVAFAQEKIREARGSLEQAKRLANEVGMAPDSELGKKYQELSRRSDPEVLKEKFG